MRIRKRPVPFPLSSLSPVPLSDPLLHNLNYSPPPPPPMVQLHTQHDPAPTQPKPSNPVEKTALVGHPHPQPSDHHLNQGLLPIGRAGKGWGFSDAAGGEKHKEHNKQDCGLELLILKGEEEEEYERGSRDGENNDIRKESILGAETLMGFASGSSSFAHRAVGRWCEGEKAFPLKKRRGSFGRGANMEEKDRKSMKTKMNKKCATQQQNEDDQKQEDEEAKQGLDHANIIVRSNSSATKKRARGSGALMEGSRCSRVNGRGWRCCQQTLVGYSLCEHHLGKGRLRSMTSVRSRSMAKTTTSTTSTTSTASIEKELKRLSASRSSVESPWKEDTKAAVLLDEHDVDEAKGDRDENGAEEEGKPLMVKRKRMKLGIVKARSMSSLLGQTSSAIAAVADEDGVNNKK